VAEKAKPRKITIGRGDGHHVLNRQAAKREVIDA
jgi:HSP20 family protein